MASGIMIVHMFTISFADLDNNGQLDETELKAIFINDLDKAYKPGQNREREEEIERMREHVMNEVDSNRDRMVSLEELLAQTKREEFKKDPGWETVDQQPQFTHEEYMEFERRRQAEIQQLIAQGRVSVRESMICQLPLAKFEFWLFVFAVAGTSKYAEWLLSKRSWGRISSRTSKPNSKRSRISTATTLSATATTAQPTECTISTTTTNAISTATISTTATTTIQTTTIPTAAVP